MPGAVLCLVLAMAAEFLSGHYGGPRLLYALLLGLALHTLMDLPSLHKGVEFCGRSMLRLGIVLLGARVTLEEVAGLGAATALLVALAVVATITLGYWIGRCRGLSAEHSYLAAGAVAICGASAAMAFASVMSPTRENERFTLMTIVSVTLLSTLAMILYPYCLSLMKIDGSAAGVILGGTIHDVAQVVAAGMLLGDGPAESATVVKLLRVLFLAPAVLVIGWLCSRDRSRGSSTVPAVPHFLIAFVAMVLLASSEIVPQRFTDTAASGSSSLLLVAIAAAGLKTKVKEMLLLGWTPLLVIVATSAFLFGFVLLGTRLLGL